MIGTVSNKFNLPIAVQIKSARKKNELSEEKEEWIENFLERSNLLEIINGSKIITNDKFSSFTEAFEQNSDFAKCTTSSKRIRRWLTKVTSHTLRVCVKSAKLLHFKRKKCIQV